MMTDRIASGLLYNNWYIGIPPEQGRLLAQAERAVCVGECHDVLGLRGADPIFVRQHLVRTLEEARERIQAYRTFAGKFALSTYFRGQNEDYLRGSHLRVVPAAHRSERWSRAYGYRGETLVDEQFGPWLKVIQSEFKIEPGTGSLYRFSDPEQPLETIAPPLSDRRAGAQVGTNPLLMAIAMHYGFPTPCLDVSADEAVSIWFALHHAERRSDGALRFAPLATPAEGAPLRSVPSLYIYLQKHSDDNPVVDLRQMVQLTGIAERPFVQSAVALPFLTFASVSNPMMMDAGFGVIQSGAFRYPTAVIKLLFTAGEIYTARPELDSEHLFPKGDCLYQAFMHNQVPELAIYA